jgi:type IV pilus assembly protein PilB
LLELCFLTKDDFQKESRHVKDTGGYVFDQFMKDAKVSIEDFLDKLSKQYGIGMEMNPSPIVPRIKKFPVSFCLTHGIIPINEDETSILFGICTPTALNSLKNLSLMIGKKAEVCFIPPEYVLQSIQQKHIHTGPDLVKSDLTNGENSPTQLDSRTKDHVITLADADMPDRDKVDELLDLEALGMNKDTTPTENSLRTDKEKIEKMERVKLNIDIPPQQQNKKKVVAPKRRKPVKTTVSGDVITVVDDFMSEAVTSDVSDIHIEIFRDSSQIRFRSGGTLLPQNQYQDFISSNYNAVIARIKILANLDIAERRLPQDGKISYRTRDGNDVDFRISSLPTSLGERVVIRILDSSSLAVTIDAIGFTEHQKKDFISAIDAPQGMVLVTGPTGSGKSTTLYGAMNYLNKPDVNILTAEDPVEYTMPGISQVQIKDDIGLTFASALRSFLRQDPEIILVGEIRDQETADIASKAALTGHLVMSTLHTNGAIGAISRLINMGLPAYLVASSLSLVVAQRLVRKTCEACSAPVDTNNLELNLFIERYKIPSSATILKGKGCAECSGTGYKGRKGVHEVLMITTEIEDAISSLKSEGDILEIAETGGFTTLAKNAIRFVEDGSLSYDEYLRVIPQDDE